MRRYEERTETSEPNYKYANFGRWVAGIGATALALAALIGAGYGIHYLGSQNAAEDELKRLKKEGKIMEPVYVNQSQKCKVTDYQGREDITIVCEGDRNGDKGHNPPYNSSVKMQLVKHNHGKDNSGLIDIIQLSQSIPEQPKIEVLIGPKDYSVSKVKAGKVETLYQSE